MVVRLQIARTDSPDPADRVTSTEISMIGNQSEISKICRQENSQDLNGSDVRLFILKNFFQNQFFL